MPEAPHCRSAGVGRGGHEVPTSQPGRVGLEVHVFRRSCIEAEVRPTLFYHSSGLCSRLAISGGTSDAANDECQRDAQANQKSTHRRIVPPMPARITRFFAKPQNTATKRKQPGSFEPGCLSFRDVTLVPTEGLEPPRPCDRVDLNHVRLPIPPRRHSWKGPRTQALTPAVSVSGLAGTRRSALKPRNVPTGAPGLPQRGGWMQGENDRI